MTTAKSKKGQSKQSINLSSLRMIHDERKAQYGRWRRGEITNDSLRAAGHYLKEVSEQHRVLEGDNPQDHTISIKWGKR